MAIRITRISPSGYRDCFPDSSLLRDMESGTNRLRCATLQCRACTSRHRHSNYDVITSPAHDRQQDWYRDTGRRALAEVCTVPVLLVSSNLVCFISSFVSVGNTRPITELQAPQNPTRHRASTSTYSLTFRVRVVAIATQPVDRLQIRQIVHN